MKSAFSFFSKVCYCLLLVFLFTQCKESSPLNKLTAEIRFDFLAITDQKGTSFSIPLPSLIHEFNLCCGTFSIDTNWQVKGSIGRLTHSQNEKPILHHFNIRVKERNGIVFAQILTQNGFFLKEYPTRFDPKQIPHREKAQKTNLHQKHASRLAQVIPKGLWDYNHRLHLDGYNTIVTWTCSFLETKKGSQCGCHHEADHPECRNFERTIWFHITDSTITPLRANFEDKAFLQKHSLTWKQSISLKEPVFEGYSLYGITLPKSVEKSSVENLGLPLIQISESKYSIGAFSDSLVAVSFAQKAFPKFQKVSKQAFAKGTKVIDNFISKNVPFARVGPSWHYIAATKQIALYQSKHIHGTEPGTLLLINKDGFNNHKNVLDYSLKNSQLKVRTLELAYRDYEDLSFKNHHEKIAVLAQKQNKTIAQTQASLVILPQNDYNVYFSNSIINSDSSISKPKSWKKPLGNPNAKLLTSDYTVLQNDNIHAIAFKDDIESQTTIFLLDY